MSWDPWTTNAWPTLRGEVARLHRDIDSLFGRPTGRSEARVAGVFPPINFWDRGDSIEIVAELPGVKPEDLEVEVTKRVVTLRGQRRDDLPKDVALHRRERMRGGFHRSITLPDDVSSDQAEAIHRNGLLTLRLPKVPEAKPQRIQVSTV